MNLFPKKLVIDSSVIVKWLSQQDEDHIIQANKVLNDVKKGKIELFAPELAKYEVANAILTGKGIMPSNVKISLATLFSAPIQFVSETIELAESSYKFAYESGITYYDASFASLANLLDAPLVTDNPKHQAKVKGIETIPLKDYK
ncbi:hypothetical protein A3A48_00050 [Candidatus Curtissbacteria bacterium RIFCSPLOWO2_01_FULL_37_9]|uniref:PIN domain-containing protein n=1 Tax=Candidatus Curtissbacteria bacterium RIFCSPLOWO2_01_FULL_37_9 TaxID=1797724 RepID=A0A1F5GW25_9BACT|nr:MAG: hypothetical protein A3A48_00050 [Candidatus Curtissbacteria bacterium RIFCSPLOWO2_01_FULL_37_9]